MPQLKYKDPADGLWKPVPVGGAAAVVPNEVTINATEPTDGSELWLDVDEPNTNGGLLDQNAADDLYVNTTGDSMTGQLGLVAPALVANAARWADGLPRFANAAARDAAYTAIGGPSDGMKAWTADDRVEWAWSEAQSAWTSLAPSPAQFVDMVMTPPWAIPGGYTFRMAFNGMAVTLNGIVHKASDLVAGMSEACPPGSIPSSLLPPLPYFFMVPSVGGGNIYGPLFQFEVATNGALTCQILNGGPYSWESNTWIFPNTTWVPVS